MDSFAQLRTFWRTYFDKPLVPIRRLRYDINIAARICGVSVYNEWKFNVFTFIAIMTSCNFVVFSIYTVWYLWADPVKCLQVLCCYGVFIPVRIEQNPLAMAVTYSYFSRFLFYLFRNLYSRRIRWNCTFASDFVVKLSIFSNLARPFTRMMRHRLRIDRIASESVQNNRITIWAYCCRCLWSVHCCSSLIHCICWHSRTNAPGFCQCWFPARRSTHSPNTTRILRIKWPVRWLHSAAPLATIAISHCACAIIRLVLRSSRAPQMKRWPIGIDDGASEPSYFSCKTSIRSSFRWTIWTKAFCWCSRWHRRSRFRCRCSASSRMIGSPATAMSYSHSRKCFRFVLSVNLCKMTWVHSHIRQTFSNFIGLIFHPQNTRLVHILYGLPWYRFTIDQQKDIRRILMRLHRSKELWMGPFAPLNLETGSTVNLMNGFQRWFTLSIECFRLQITQNVYTFAMMLLRTTEWTKTNCPRIRKWNGR